MTSIPVDIIDIQIYISVVVYAIVLLNPCQAFRVSCRCFSEGKNAAAGPATCDQVIVGELFSLVIRKSVNLYNARIGDAVPRTSNGARSSVKRRTGHLIHDVREN